MLGAACTVGLAPAVWLAAVASVAGGLGFYMLHNTLQTHATQMAPTLRATAVTAFASSPVLRHSAGEATAGADRTEHDAASPSEDATTRIAVAGRTATRPGLRWLIAARSEDRTELPVAHEGDGGAVVEVQVDAQGQDVGLHLRHVDTVDVDDGLRG